MILLINPLSSVKHDIIWYSIDDCNGMIKLVNTLLWNAVQRRRECSGQKKSQIFDCSS